MLAALIAVVAIAAIAFTVTAYRRDWSWTGLPADPGDGSPVNPPRTAKTLWDWLQLLVVPLVLALAAFALNAAQADRDRRQEDRRAAQQRVFDQRRAEREQANAQDRAREDTLRTYLRQMSQLITDSGLAAPRHPADPDTKALARTLTLVALRRLDGPRKGVLVQFLAEAGLIMQTVPWYRTSRGWRAGAISRSQPRVSLVGADLRGAVMPIHLGSEFVSGPRGTGLRSRAAAFEDADLRAADFRGRDLTGVSFRRADLRGARFDRASLSGTLFEAACLSGATFIAAREEPSLDSGADFSGAAGRGVDFTDAVLDNALVWAQLVDVKLTGASTTGVRWPLGWTSTGLQRPFDARARAVCFIDK